MNGTQIVLGAFILIGTLAGAWFTRGSAKDTLGVTMITTVLEEQRKSIDELRAEVDELKKTEAVTRRNVRKHLRWDDRIYDQAVQAGWDIPPPPPLEAEPT